MQDLKKDKAYMSHFINLISRYIPGEDAALNTIASFITVRKLMKNDFLLRAGTICQNLSFVKEGYCLMYRDVGEKEVITEFYFKEMLMSDYVSFIRQMPSEHYIRAFDGCEIEEINYNDLQHLYYILPIMERVGRILFEQMYCPAKMRMLSYKDDPPEIRYLKLMDERPDLFQRVPQYLIASYLGVTDVGLCKIRRRLHDNKS